MRDWRRTRVFDVGSAVPDSPQPQETAFADPVDPEKICREQSVGTAPCDPNGGMRGAKA